MEQQELLQALRQVVREEIQGVENRMDEKLEAMDARMDMRMDKMDSRMNKIDIRMDKIDSRMDIYETQFRHTGMLLEKLDDKVQLIYENQVDIIKMNRRIENLEIRQDQVETEVNAIKLAVSKIVK